MYSSDSEAPHDAVSPDKVLDLLDEIYYFIGVDGRVRQWNERLPEVTGYTNGEIRNMLATDFFVSDDRGDITDAISTAVSEQRKVTVEADFLTKDEHVIPYEFVGKPVLDEEQIVRGLVGIGRDITDQKKRKHELRQLGNAVRHAGHAILITDDEGVIEYVNPAFEEMSGYTYQQAVGANPRILNSGEHDEEFYAQLWETISGGDVWNSDVTNRRLSGELYTINQTIAPIRGSAGGIIGYVSIQIEITSRQLREQQLEVFQRIFRHNLRNRGTVIMGQLDLLKSELDADAGRERIQSIERSVQSLIAIGEKAREARQVLTASLGDGAQQELLTSLRHSTERVMASYPDAEITVESELTRSVWINPHATPAFQELIENAVKHSGGETAAVEVSVTTSDATVRVSIADNGPGVPENEQHIIREGTEDPLNHSAGLGLWVSNWLVTYVGGNIDIGVDQSGTTVTVTVPYSGQHPAQS